MALFFKTLILIGCAAIIGCSTGPCARKDRFAKPMTSSKLETVFVFKADGSLQCQPDTGKSPEKMAQDLGPMKIHSQKSVHDGKMRVQLCGTPTGQINVYEINSEDLQKAQAVGFKVWTSTEN